MISLPDAGPITNYLSPGQSCLAAEGKDQSSACFSYKYSTFRNQLFPKWVCIWDKLKEVIMWRRRKQLHCLYPQSQTYSFNDHILMKAYFFCSLLKSVVYLSWGSSRDIIFFNLFHFLDAPNFLFNAAADRICRDFLRTHLRLTWW